MAIDKAVDSAQLDAAMKATADAIRTQGGTSEQIAWDKSTGFADAIGALSNITLAGIEVVTPPNKTKYYPGEMIDTTGAVLKATYSNGATRTLTGGWTAVAQNGDSIFVISDTSIRFSFKEGGYTKTCTQEVTMLNLITVSSTVETGRAVSADRTLRAVTYYDGRYIMVETTSAEQVYTFHFLKDSPTSLTTGSIRADRPYPVSCIAVDGTYLWFGLTTGRGTTPYSNRYVLRAPYADFVANSYALNYWTGEDASVEAVSGLDATNGYFTIVGSRNGVGSIGHLIPSSGGATFSGMAPFDDVCAAGAGAVFISEEGARVGYAANTATYSTKWLTVSNAPPVKVASNGDSIVTLTRGDRIGNTWYSARNVDISSGAPSVTGRPAQIKVADEDAEIIGMEAVGDYYAVVSKAADGTAWLGVIHTRGITTPAKMFELNITNPVALCKTDEGLTVVGQANGKYTITQLDAMM